MSSDEAQKRAFRERVDRIQKRGAGVQLAPIGPAEEAPTGRRKRQKPVMVKPPRKPRAGGNPLTFLLAVVIGAAAVVLARYGRAALDQGGLTGEQAASAMALDFGIACGLGLVLVALFRLYRPRSVVALGIGAGSMLLTMHNLVHLAPELWAQAFPPDWVAEVLATTQPRSILIQGVSFVL